MGFREDAPLEFTEDLGLVGLPIGNMVDPLLWTLSCEHSYRSVGVGVTSPWSLKFSPVRPTAVERPYIGA